MRRVFLTGGGGFIGSRLLSALVQHGHSVVALDRSGTVSRSGLLPAGQAIHGDILAPETYRDALAAVDVVVHLAASTGRAPSAEHWRVNATGTGTLLNECRAAGVKRVLFVSSIATAFPDLTRYPYAQAKAEAERLVASSGIPHVVLRPTMVLGQRSPILAALSTLALLPVIPVFGSGRTPVQPVSVDDVVGVIISLLERDRFANETIDVGGLEALPIEELLQEIRVARTGRRGSVWHVPLGVLLPVLSGAESIGLARLLPFTVGQLATFRFPGTAARHPAIEAEREHPVSLRQMMSSDPEPVDDDSLDEECRVFTRHLLGIEPTRYIVDHYVRAHLVSPKFAPDDGFDRYLVRFAARHFVLARLADSYARVFVSGSLLRRKLVLLLAILETAPPSHRLIDQPPGGGPILIAGRLVAQGILWLAGLVAASLFLAPARLTMRTRKSR
jgi:nucleoside-diphosphate-sugar epimerase